MTPLPLLDLLASLDRRTLPADEDVEALLDRLTNARPAMQATPRSSFASAIGYDPSCLVLELVLRGGTVHRYIGVPPAYYERLASAPSLGRAYQALIKGRFIGIPVARVPCSSASDEAEKQGI